MNEFITIKSGGQEYEVDIKQVCMVSGVKEYKETTGYLSRFLAGCENVEHYFYFHATVGGIKEEFIFDTYEDAVKNRAKLLGVARL